MSWIVFVLEFSKVLPIEGGEIFVPLTQGRPSENDIQVKIILLSTSGSFSVCRFPRSSEKKSNDWEGI
jgi:hypothetical protein